MIVWRNTIGIKWHAILSYSVDSTPPQAILMLIELARRIEFVVSSVLADFTPNWLNCFRDVNAVWIGVRIMLCLACFRNTQTFYSKSYFSLETRRAEFPGWFRQRFPRCTEIEWDMCTKINVLYTCLLPSWLRSFYGAPMPSNVLASHFVAKYSLDDFTQITEMQCMADTKHLLPSSYIVVLSFPWRRIHDTTIRHLETSRDLRSTHPDTNTHPIMSCCTPSIVSEMYVDL